MKWKTYTIILLIALAVAGTVHAATTLEVGIPGTDALPGSAAPSVPMYIKYLYYFVLGLVGIAGFSSLVFWGAVWAGSGIVDKKAQAIAGIKNTLTGIGIALTAFILLNTINPDLIVIKTPNVADVTINSVKKEVLFVNYVAIWTVLKVGQTCQSVYKSPNWVSTNQDKCSAEAKSRPEYVAEGYNACCMYAPGTPDAILSNALRWVQINPNQMTCELLLGPEWRKPDMSCPSYIRPPEAEGKSDYICCSKN